jgi:hypothetical protein
MNLSLNVNGADVGRRRFVALVLLRIRLLPVYHPICVLVSLPFLMAFCCHSYNTTEMKWFTYHAYQAKPTNDLKKNGEIMRLI